MLRIFYYFFYLVKKTIFFLPQESFCLVQEFRPGKKKILWQEKRKSFVTTSREHFLGIRKHF